MFYFYRIHDLFDELDGNGDGRLTEIEFIEATQKKLGVLSLPQEVLEREYRRMDRNGDGNIEVSELCQFVADARAGKISTGSSDDDGDGIPDFLDDGTGTSNRNSRSTSRSSSGNKIESGIKCGSATHKNNESKSKNDSTPVRRRRKSWVGARRGSRRGGKVLIKTLGPGDGFGEGVLVRSNATRGAAAIAHEVVECAKLSRSTYDRTVKVRTEFQQTTKTQKIIY